MSEASSTDVLKGLPLLELASVELRVVDGPDRGLSLVADRASVRVGTDASNQLILHDTTVSRIHCELQIRRGSVRIVDLGSTNGTRVDSVVVQSADVGPGSVIRVGATTIVVDYGDEPMQLRLSERESFGHVLGASTEMRRVYAVLERVAPSTTTLLIVGETGTGKEVVARSLHEASPRHAKPYVVVDCGAIAENLIESELFGHARGAFSGASGERRGLFEEAHGGTLFLDEIGELPLALQPKLLRAMETREVRRVGENTTRPIDVRVIAATNRPLATSVNQGTFRSDLYFRLAVVELDLPPLRARREDIPVLAQHFYSRTAGENESLPDEFVASLMSRAWPGNVRELRNFIERSACLGFAKPREAPRPASATLPLGLEAVVPLDLPFKEARVAWMERFEQVYLSALLRKTGGNITHAAELAGLHRRSLQRLLDGLGLRGK